MSNRIKCGTALFACAALTLVLAGCGHHGISGEYLSQTADEVILLQVTQSGDHDLSGSLISTAYERSGKLRHDSAAFTGSINHNQLALNIGMGGLSGIVEGDTITLSSPAMLFAPPQKIELKRASRGAYDQAVNEMQQEAPKRQAAIEQKQHEEAEDQAIADQAQALGYWASSSHTYGLNGPMTRARHSLEIAQSDLSHALRSSPSSHEAKRQYRNTLLLRTWIAKDISGLNGQLAELEDKIRDWDTKIAQSPCRAETKAASRCADEIKAEGKYQAIKKALESQIATARKESAKLTADMDSIVAKAKTHAGE